MNFVLFLTTEIKCYYNNARLIGNSQVKQFELILTPSSENKFCIAGDDEPSTVDLLYMNGSVANKITQNYVHSATQQSHIVFDLAADPTKYDMISLQTKLAYDAKIISYLSSKGAISIIYHTQMNTTNCWSDLELEVDLLANELVINGYPLDCVISIADSVRMEFSDGSTHEFEVIGKDEPEYYFNYNTFVFSATRHYYLARQQLAPAAYKDFDQFIALVRKGTLPEFKLVIVTQISGISLTQNIVGEVQKIVYPSNGCLRGLGMRGYLNSNDITVVGDFQQFPTACARAHKYEAYAAYHMSSQAEKLDGVTSLVEYADESIQLQYGLTYLLPRSVRPYDQLSAGAFVYFFALDDQDQLVFIDFIELNLQLSCVDQIYVMVRRDRACSYITFFADCRVESFSLYVTDDEYNAYAAFALKPNKCGGQAVDKKYGSPSSSFASLKQQLKAGENGRILAQASGEFIRVKNVTLLDDYRWVYGFLGIAACVLVASVSGALIGIKMIK